MTEKICSYCSIPIDNSYNFCVNCEKQIKCLACGELLIPHKSKCLMCGKSLNGDARGSMNEFVLEESHTRNSSTRTVKGTLSDIAITQVASLLSKTVPPPTSIPAKGSRVVAGQISLPLPYANQLNDTPDVEETPTTPPSGSIKHESETESQIKKYFADDGKGSVVALTIDFKGQTRKEQQIRFMLLFVHAYHEILGKPVPMQQTVLDGLKNNNMYDINAKTTYFKLVETNYLTHVNEGYIVNIPGKKQIEKILDEIENENNKGFTEWDKHKKSRGKKQVNAEVEKQVSSWVDKDVKIGNFDIRKLKTPTKYAMFGLYLITNTLAVEKAVSYGAAYEFLTKKFSTIPISKDAFRKAFTRPSNAARFEKTSEGKYYLTPSAEKEVQGWLEGKPIEDEEV